MAGPPQLHRRRLFVVSWAGIEAAAVCGRCLVRCMPCWGASPRLLPACRSRRRTPPPCTLRLPFAVQDIKTRASEGKHLRVLERSIFSDRQVGRMQHVRSHLQGCCAAHCLARIVVSTAQQACGASWQARPGAALGAACLLTALPRWPRPTTLPQVFVRAMHREGKMADFEVSVYNQM